VQYFLGFENNFCGAPFVERQSVRPENLAFVSKGVLFIGINLVSGGPPGAQQIRQQDADWVSQQLQAKGSLVRAAVVFAQAGPESGQILFFDQFRQAASAFGKPVLYVHGDGHSWIQDNPWPENNILRIQVERGTKPPIQVTVTTNNPATFSINRTPWGSGSQPINRPPCGQTGPAITVNPSSHDYGQVNIGSSASQTFVVSNAGTENLVVTSTSLTTGEATEFNIESGGGAFTLSAGASRNVVVSFNPAFEGSQSTKLRFASNDPNDNPLDVNLTGTGIIPGSAPIVFNPTDDAYVSSSNATTNYGAASNLRLKKSSPVLNSYLKFVVSGLSNAVQSAKLRLYVTAASNDGGAIYLTSNYYLGSTTLWTESGLNYNNAPSLSGSPLSNVGSVTSGQWIEFDVTSAVTGNGTFSFALKNASSTTVQYSSKEGANAPELVIQTGLSPLSGAPSITSFTPSSGPVGTQVTITGDNFMGVTQVTFNGVAASNFTVASATQIYVNVPSGATTGTIRVTSSAGTTVGNDNFTVTPPPAPTLSSFNPNNGPAGTQVTIFGDNFTGATQITFNGIATSTFTVVSNSEIRANVPPTATTGKISVTTPGGTVTSTGDFTVTVPPPTVVFNPTDDAYVNSSDVTKNYGNLNSLRVRQSSTILYSYLRFVLSGLTNSVQSAKVRMYVTQASNSGGSLYLVSNYYLGTTTPWTESGLNYNNAPSLSGSPLSTVGSVASGQWVEFDVTAAVTGNGTFSFGLKNSSSTAAIYSSKEGANDPELVIVLGNSAPPAPMISSFTPNSGPVGTQVTISGDNFSGATQVAFNGVATSNFTVISNSEIRTNVPSGASTGKISVTTPGGTATSADDFTVIPPPAPIISSFTPMSGSVGAAVTILGNNFTGATQVTFNGVAANPFTVISNSEIRANVPSGATTGKIAVTTPGGTATSADDFTVTAPPPVVSFTPTHDAYIRFANLTTSYGANTIMRVRESTSGELYRAYLKFEVTGLSGIVQSAKLRLYVTDASVDGGSVYLVSNNYEGTATPWTESGLNWNNAPAITGTPLSSAGAVSLNSWVEWEVTAAVTGNGMFSFGLKNNSADVVYYNSKEGGHPPELVIETVSTSLSASKINSSGSEVTELELDQSTTPLPEGLALGPNYPNPFNAGITINYHLPEAAHVRLAIFNLLGQQVRTLIDGFQPVGNRHARWNGRDESGREVVSGVYFVHLQVGPRKAGLTRTITLQK
jgi:flagellar hook assembly protein FlgD